MTVLLCAHKNIENIGITEKYQNRKQLIGWVSAFKTYNKALTTGNRCCTVVNDNYANGRAEKNGLVQ